MPDTFTPRRVTTLTTALFSPVLAALCALALGATPAACHAGKLLAREGAEVFAKISVAAGRLNGMSGDLDIQYTRSDAFRQDHRARFWFSKPFRLRVDQRPSAGGSDGVELYCADMRVALYLPDRKQVVEFELGNAESGDVLPHFFSLFTIPGFTQGALLPDIESQFATQVEEVDAGWRVTLTPTAASFYRSALGLSHVTADIDRKSLMPRSLELHEEQVVGTRVFCRIDLAHLEFNPQIPPHLFLYKPRPNVRRVPATEVLREWVMDALARAGGQGTNLLQGFERKLQDLQKKPWDF